MKRSCIERHVDRGVADRQAAHVGPHLQGIRPAVDVEKVDGDDVRVAKIARGPPASGSDVDHHRALGSGPSARECGGGSGHRLETPAPQSRFAAFRVLSTIRADPALSPAQGGVLGGETVGGRALLIVEQVQVASSRNDRPAAALALSQARFRRGPAAWAPQELVEPAQHPQRKKAGTQANRDRAMGPAPDAMTWALTSTARKYSQRNPSSLTSNPTVSASPVASSRPRIPAQRVARPRSSRIPATVSPTVWPTAKMNQLGATRLVRSSRRPGIGFAAPAVCSRPCTHPTPSHFVLAKYSQ